MTATFLPVRMAGVPLEPAGVHRRPHQDVIDAGAFVQDFRRARPRATAAENVGVEDRLGRPDRVLVQDLPNELGNVDVRGTGTNAGGVVAEQATGRLDQHFVGRQGRRQIREVFPQLLVAEPFTRPRHGHPFSFPSNPCGRG